MWPFSRKPVPKDEVNVDPLMQLIDADGIGIKDETYWLELQNIPGAAALWILKGRPALKQSGGREFVLTKRSHIALLAACERHRARKQAAQHANYPTATQIDDAIGQALIDLRRRQLAELEANFAR